MGTRSILPFALSGLFALSCEGVSSDDGRDAWVQVEGGTFFREEMPSAEAGPGVVTATLRGRVARGSVSQSAVGDLERTATAIAMKAEGDVGYWVVPAKLPSAAAPDFPTFEIAFAVSSRLRIGRTHVVLRAVDAERRFGAPLVKALDVVSAEPRGRLVVSLAWENAADLDLHVVLPSGVEIEKRNPTEYERPPPGVQTSAPKGGVLDRDSNAQCVPDGRTSENVVWSESPPRGDYLVRVDTYSLCGEPSAYWRVLVRFDDVVVAEARGLSTEYDARYAHNRGDGVLALAFHVP